MFTTYFSLVQITVFVVIAIIHITSIYYFSFNRNIKLALFFLFLGGLIIRLTLITFDDYLHTWDEQFHALVAKNMGENLIKPLLFKYKPLHDIANNWSNSQIWLHKQPFFLWQMALSIKTFGISVFSVRFPSALMSSLLIVVIFRMGKLVINPTVGYLSSLLYAVCGYLLDFNTGIYSTDHNDVCFVFYVTLSIWAYTEYRVLNKQNYIWLIGLFAGLAVLNKWMAGLLVFSGWGVSLFFIHSLKSKIAEIKSILKALLVCFITFLPWQTYILLAFPKESLHEYAYNSAHLFTSIEGHSGDNWFYFEQAIFQYGSIMAYLLPFALVVLFIDIKEKLIRGSYITYVVGVYLFFTIVKTKMPAFCLIIYPLLFIALGNLLYRSITYIHLIKLHPFILKLFEFFILTTICFMSINIEMIQYNHTDWVKTDGRAMVRHSQIRNTKLARSIAGKYDQKKTIIFNANSTENIAFMFFSGYTTYDRLPTLEEYSTLQKDHYKTVVINNYGLIPDYLTNNEVSFINNCKKEKIINLKTKSGKYICNDEKEGFIIANREKASQWETFSFFQFENNECAIRAHNNNFLSINIYNQNEIKANRLAVGDWEIFTEKFINDSTVAFKAVNGKYLSLDEKSLRISAKADGIGNNEKFKLIQVKK